MPRSRFGMSIFAILITIALYVPATISAQESAPTTSTNDQNIQSLEPSTQNTDISGNTSVDQPNNAEITTQKPSEVKLPSFSYKDTKETILGRSLVLSIGFFPFTYFYTGFVVDITRFAAHNFSTAYAPWPFKTQYSVALTDSEMWIKLGIASVSSLVFGFLGTLIK